MKDNQQQPGQALYKSKNIFDKPSKHHILSMLTQKLIENCIDNNKSLVSENKRKQLFNQLVHEFRNTGKTQASSHGAVYTSGGAISHLGASSSNIGSSALNSTGGGVASSIKPKKSHSIDKKGTMSSSQVQQQLQIVASLSGSSGPDSKKIPAKKGKRVPSLNV